MNLNISHVLFQWTEDLQFNQLKMSGNDKKKTVNFNTEEKLMEFWWNCRTRNIHWMHGLHWNVLFVPILIYI